MSENIYKKNAYIEKKAREQATIIFREVIKDIYFVEKDMYSDSSRYVPSGSSRYVPSNVVIRFLNSTSKVLVLGQDDNKFVNFKVV